MAASKHQTDGQWLKIIGDLLGDDRTKRSNARTTMWCEVLHYVERRAQLQIGPLSDDVDVRRDIGLRVLRKLEVNDYAHLREWRDRQLHGRDRASWWAFVKLVTRHRAIEYARTCALNVARRGEPFQWVRIHNLDPVIFDQTLDSATEFLSTCTEPALYQYMERFQAASWPTNPQPSPPPPTPEEAPVRPRRDRS